MQSLVITEKGITLINLYGPNNDDKPGAVARPPGMRTVAGSILTSGNILSWNLAMK